MALIWAMSSLHFPNLPVDSVPLKDKGVHFVEYGILGGLVAHAALRTWPRHAIARVLAVSVWLTVGWGVLDEIHQAFIPGRAADLLDLVADSVGAVFGTGFRYMLALVSGQRRARG